MATQATRADRLAAADDIIVNDGQRDAVVTAVARLHNDYLALAAKKQGEIRSRGL
jgi:dephospho-CoA kinase